MVGEKREFGIDLKTYQQDKDKSLKDRSVDLSGYQPPSKENPGWLDTVGEIFTQAGLGAAKAFTWPADVLKAGAIGEGLANLSEMEEAFGPIDRQKYFEGLLDTAGYFPTQELAEEKLEELTGFELRPRTELGKRVRQGAEIATLSPGGAGRKLLSGGLGAVTTHVLKKTGVGEGKAEFIGDIAGFSPTAIQKIPTVITKQGAQFEKAAQKYALPFVEFMNREKEPLIKGKLFKSTEDRLKHSFNLSSQQAMEKIIKDELPLKRLRDKGVNLEALSEYAYTRTNQIAKENNKIINTGKIVDNIDKEIERIKSLAPSPSDSQKAAINILENERDALKVSKPNSEQLINQHINYNADMKNIYRKPEFSGKEEQVRKTYEFLKNQLVESMEKQGSKETANAFKAANKIYHEKSKLDQTESLLKKAFGDGKYNPKKFDKFLSSKQSNFLKRNMSPQAIKDLEEIAKYGEQAQERMGKFLENGSPTVMNEIKSWGQLAPMLFFHNVQGALLSVATPLARHIQGKLLTRPATREIYKATMKHASEGAFNLLKKDFIDLESSIAQEYGTVDEFMDAMMLDLPLGMD